MQPGHARAAPGERRGGTGEREGGLAFQTNRTVSHTAENRAHHTDGEELMPRGGGGRDGGHSKPGYPAPGSSVITKKVIGRSRGFF